MKNRVNYRVIGMSLGILAGGITGWFLGVYPLFIALGGSLGIGIGSSLASRR